MQQAQTLVALVGAGIKTREEARAELGLAETPVAKFNPYHDEQGRFTTAEGAVEPGTHRPVKPDRGIEVADNEYGPITDEDAIRQMFRDGHFHFEWRGTDAARQYLADLLHDAKRSRDSYLT